MRPLGWVRLRLPALSRRGQWASWFPLRPLPAMLLMSTLIVSKDAPFWPQEKRARQDNACLGPLRNEAGDWLTGTVVKRAVSMYPTPVRALGPRPTDREDEIRAVGSAVDEQGVLWLVEQRGSKSS